MNNLSWALYGIEVVGRLGPLTAFLAVLSMVACAGALLFGAIMRESDDRDDEKAGKKLQGFAKPLLWSAVVLAMIAVMLPSQRSLYLIVGSQISETVVTSEDGQRVIDALRKKVLDYLGVPDAASAD